MSWTATPIHFIDFEGSLASGILEYGIVNLHGPQIVSTHTQLCRPTGPIRVEDRQLHHLDAATLSPHEPFANAFSRFAQLRATGPLAAHFAHAENSLLKSVWPYPPASPDFNRPGHTLADWGPWIDTGRLYAELFPTLPSGQLAQLIAATAQQPDLDQLAAQHCPYQRSHYHAALYDALAAALLFLDLTRRPELRDATLPWLLQHSTANPARRESLRQPELF